MEDIWQGYLFFYYCHLQIYQSQETPELPSADSRQMSIAVFQSMPPELDVSFPHTQVEEIQSISLEVWESDRLHDFLQAVYIIVLKTNVTVAKFIPGMIICQHVTDKSSRYRRIFVYKFETLAYAI